MAGLKFLKKMSSFTVPLLLQICPIDMLGQLEPPFYSTLVSAGSTKQVGTDRFVWNMGTTTNGNQSGFIRILPSSSKLNSVSTPEDLQKQPFSYRVKNNELLFEIDSQYLPLKVDLYSIDGLAIGSYQLTQTSSVIAVEQKSALYFCKVMVSSQLYTFKILVP